MTTPIVTTMFVPPIKSLLVTNVLRIQLPKYHDNDDLVSHLRQLTKVCVTNGENTHDHKLYSFSKFIERKSC
jgi:hypothetical protein